ncbi:MAG: serine hydrolase [Polyangiaceae bacterium]|nr:serine hydrolase [Myxococcales bacterium]MCB9588008.1 serine hydrolase [Polyangiaceae bacterium]
MLRIAKVGSLCLLVSLLGVGCSDDDSASGAGGSAGSSTAGSAGIGGEGGSAGSSAGTGGASGAAGSGGTETGGTAGQATADLQSLIETAQTEIGLPALAGVVLRSGGIVDQGVSGVRRLSQPDLATLDDHWHIGSNVKAMTATLCAMLVEDGKLEFDAKLSDLFPEVTGIDLGLADVTLEMLLQHRAGIAAYTSRLSINVIPTDVADDRQKFAEWLIQQPPATPIGEFNYSNAGYGLVGAILERASGMTYEELLDSRLVQPLGMQSKAWLSWPASTEAEQPWAHWSITGPLQEHPPTDVSMPLGLSTAGNFSFSLLDYARFVQLHLRARREDPELLSQGSFDKLHTPNGDYAMGWVVASYNGKPLLAHEGSLDGFDAHTVIWPTEDLALVLVNNAGANFASEPVAMRWLAWSELPWPAAK